MPMTTPNGLKRLVLAAACGALLILATRGATGADTPAPTDPKGPPMKLGAFSVSLAVKDLAASRAFYETLGFTSIGGNGKNFVILKNDTAIIGLFQGMFDRNILTFNPGWNQECQTLADFEDVRDLQRRLVESGITPVKPADDNGAGPDHFVLVDPDGNQVLVDQHVARPAK